MRTIPHDKALHLIAGQLAAVPALVFAPWPTAAVIGAGCCAAAAVLREVYNRHRGGLFDLAGGAALLAVTAAAR